MIEELIDKVVVATTYTLNIPQLYPMVGLRKDQGSFPVMNENRAMDRSQCPEGNRDGVRVQSDKNIKSIHKCTIHTGKLKLIAYPSMHMHAYIALNLPRALHVSHCMMAGVGS